MIEQSLSDTVSELKAIAEPTRLRVLALLQEGELSVGELAQILGQSQPRLSRHMKFLTAAGLVERLPEGAWVFYRLPAHGRGAELAKSVLSFLDANDPEIKRDHDQLSATRAARKEAAEHYFSNVATDWDRLRSLQYPETEIEAAILEAAGDRHVEFLVDMGTGTGRMLTLFADRVKRAEGLDLSHQMLTIARNNIANADAENVTVRHSDAHSTPYADASADLVIIHQVLHYLDQPDRVVSEAARILKPEGRLLIIDFAPHVLEYLRIDHAHRHLGLHDDQIQEWTQKAQLNLMSPIRFEAPTKDGLAVIIWAADKLSHIGERAA